MMQYSESISTSVATQTQALKPVISRNKVGERLKALLKNNISFSPSNNHGYISNKNSDYESDPSQMSASTGPNTFESKNRKLSKRTFKKDLFDKEFSELHHASNKPSIQTPSRKEGLRIRSPANKKCKLTF